MAGQSPEVTAQGDASATAFEHIAMFYAGDDEFVSGSLEFLEDGLAAGEFALVSVPSARIELLRPRLSAAAAERVRLVPMEDLARNPAWLVSAWLDFVGPHLEDGRRVRGISEPIWPARTDDELVECIRHEALLNLALADADGFRLLCPYDLASLPTDTLDSARSNHRHVCDGGETHASTDYSHQVPAQLDLPLPARPVGATSAIFEGNEVWALRRRIAEDAASAGLAAEPREDLTVAISEALSNSVSHGGGRGEIAWWTADDRFICEIVDHGYISDPLAGRVKPQPEQGDGRGLWLMHQLCDLVQIRVFADGTQTVRLQISC